MAKKRSTALASSASVDALRSSAQEVKQDANSCTDQCTTLSPMASTATPDQPVTSATIVPLRSSQKPARMRIYAQEKSLESLLEEFAGIWEFSEKNRVMYRDIWDQYLPKTPDGEKEAINRDWCMAYDPIVDVRLCYKLDAELPPTRDQLRYFIIIHNSGRDNRPTQPVKSPDADHASKEEKEQKDALQENLINKGMIIAEFDDFYFCPNGYPYHRFASLLIARDASRKQGYPTPADIETWMRFSILTKQYVFFNSPHAGASVPYRLHAQVVDPAGIRFEDRQVLYPLLNDKIVRRRPARRAGIEVLDGYGIKALVLRGRDAPHLASLAAKKIRDEQGHWFNIMIREKEVFIVPRNAEKETSHCIGKKVGAYEMSGVILVGNIEEPLRHQLDLDRVVGGATIFSQLNYDQVSSNIAAAAADLADLENKL